MSCNQCAAQCSRPWSVAASPTEVSPIREQSCESHTCTLTVIVRSLRTVTPTGSLNVAHAVIGTDVASTAASPHNRRALPLTLETVVVASPSAHDQAANARVGTKWGQGAAYRPRNRSGSRRARGHLRRAVLGRSRGGPTR